MKLNSFLSINFLLILFQTNLYSFQENEFSELARDWYNITKICNLSNTIKRHLAKYLKNLPFSYNKFRNALIENDLNEDKKFLNLLNLCTDTEKIIVFKACKWAQDNSLNLILFNYYPNSAIFTLNLQNGQIIKLLCNIYNEFVHVVNSNLESLSSSL